MFKTEFREWWRLPQQLRFLIAGAYNTLFGYIVFGVLFLWLGSRIHYLVIGLFAYAISVVNAFILHRCLVFRFTESWLTSFVRFNFSQLAVLAFGMAALYGLVDWGHFNPLLAQAFVTMLSVLLTYALHRQFSFRDSSKGG